MQAGANSLLRDRNRPSRIRPLAPEIAERVVALTLGPPPGETTHWTAPMMAKMVGISVSSVQRIWRSHGLQPHRVCQFKLSNDPNFAAKLHDVVGLYVDPLVHAVVLSVDEKSQIQALDRIQPGLPLKRRRCGTRTDDCVFRGKSAGHSDLMSAAPEGVELFDGWAGERSVLSSGREGDRCQPRECRCDACVRSCG